MPAETPPNVPCPRCDGEGRFLHLDVLRPPMVGLTVGTYVPCRQCLGTGEVPIAQEVMRLVSLWHHDIITTEELGNAIRNILDS